MNLKFPHTSIALPLIGSEIKNIESEFMTFGCDFCPVGLARLEIQSSSCSRKRQPTPGLETGILR
jgi:hypothetical protein